MGPLLTVVVVTVGLLVVLFAFLLARSIKKKKANPDHRGMWRWLFNILVPLGMVFVILLGTVLNVVALGYVTNSANAFFASSTGIHVDSTKDEWMNLCYEITEQGMVLMRNEKNTLPLDTENGVKVNLLGYRAYDPIYTGSGSGSTSAADAIDILTALKNAGIEVNPAPVDEGVYTVVEGEAKGVGFMGATFFIDEKPIERYTGTASFESMKEYSDIAIVVIGRTGGEGSDLTAFEGESGKHYLELSKNESDLLQKASETFETLIVVYNGANTMEMGYLDDYDVDACIWAGIPSANGFGTLGKILSGEVNPSGRLVDTWAYDVYSAPANENFGEFAASNSDAYYVDYVENIYVGYKWYETAYAEHAVITNTDTGITYDYSNYESIVQYPFGYGLSYTTFTQEIVGGLHNGDSLDPKGSIRVDVKVTNTGDVAGMEVVQLYVTVPYTNYDITNGIEKSEVSLIAYGKTSELAPGKSETITLTVDVEDIASYDSSCDNGDGTYGSYMLDAGDYVFSIRSNAHEDIQSVTTNLDESWFYSGEHKRSDDGQVAYNQFESAERGIYLSRNNAFANYEEAMSSVSDAVVDISYDLDCTVYDSAYDEIVTKDYVMGVDYAVDGDLTLSDMVGIDYDDPKWDAYIKQLTIEDMVNLATGGVYGIGDAQSAGKPYTMDSDGPQGISSMFVSSVNAVAYPSLPLLAATFNNDLARQYGNYMADQAHEIGVTGWYAPAMNIHRSAFGGRNFEYYSEDPVLSAGIGSYETLGARENSLLVYLKHFALNEQETQRSGKLHTYCSEQAIREIYLKPFEDSVKFGGATGIMSSMNYIGDVYVSCSEALCTQILRNEWGFCGMVLTDMPQGAYQTDSSDYAIRAGTDSWLAMMNMSIDTSDDADIYYLQRLAKNVLYAESSSIVLTAEVLNWKPYLYVLDAELVALVVLGTWGMIIKNKKRKNLTITEA